MTNCAVLEKIDLFRDHKADVWFTDNKLMLITVDSLRSITGMTQDEINEALAKTKGTAYEKYHTATSPMIFVGQIDNEKRSSFMYENHALMFCGFWLSEHGRDCDETFSLYLDSVRVSDGIHAHQDVQESR